MALLQRALKLHCLCLDSLTIPLGWVLLHPLQFSILLKPPLPNLGLTIESHSSKMSTIWTNKLSNPEPSVNIKRIPTHENGFKNAVENILLITYFHVVDVSISLSFDWCPWIKNIYNRLGEILHKEGYYLKALPWHKRLNNWNFFIKSEESCLEIWKGSS